MTNINSILNEIDDHGDLKQIRNAILDLINHHLQALKESIGNWEKVHLASAITALAYNINSSYHFHGYNWLKLSIFYIEKALVPINQRDENYAPIDDRIDYLTWEQLAEDVKTLRLLC